MELNFCFLSTAPKICCFTWILCRKLLLHLKIFTKPNNFCPFSKTLKNPQYNFLHEFLVTSTWILHISRRYNQYSNHIFLQFLIYVRLALLRFSVSRSILRPVSILSCNFFNISLWKIIILTHPWFLGV